MIIKHSYSGYNINTGDETFDTELGDQLKVTADEICRALNSMPKGVEELFKRVLKVRRDAQDDLVRRMSL